MADETELAKRRKALQLSQADLAALLGVTQGTVSRNENAAEPDMRYCLALEALELRRTPSDGEKAAA